MSDIVRVIVVAVLVYAWLVLVLRISGKRTLAKMNAFDLVVTVALGSTLATVVLSADVALLEGATALVVLCGAQYVVAWASVRSKAVSRSVKATPVLVVSNGEILSQALRNERLTEAEVRQSARSAGCGGLELVGAMVLETDGNLTVIRRSDLGSSSALADVSDQRPDRRTAGPSDQERPGQAVQQPERST